MGLKFEWRKWVKLPKNQLLVITLLALFIGVLVQIETSTKERATDYLAHLEDESGRFIVNEMDTLSGFMGTAPDLAEAEYEELKAIYGRAYNELNRYYIAVENDNEQASQGEYVAFLTTLKELEARDRPLPTLIEDTLALSEAKMTHLNTHHLASEESLSHPTGVYTLIEFLKVFTSVWGMVCLVLLFYDFFTFDYEHQQIRFIYTQPLKRSRLVRNKLRVVAGASLGLLGFFCVASLVYGRLSSGQWGSLKYPVAVFQVGTQPLIFTMGHLLLYLVVFLLLSLLTTLMVLLVVSYTSRKSLPTLVLTVGVLALPPVLSQVTANRLWLQFTPFYPLTFSEDWLRLVLTSQVNRQLLLSSEVVLVCLLVFSLLARTYLKKLAKEAVDH